MSTSHLPDGYQTITPYLMVDDPGRLIDFLAQAFDGRVHEKMEGPEGGVRHAEVQVGTSMLMMGVARPDWPALPTMLYLYVADCDGLYARALEAGATSEQEPRDEFYGDRTAAVKGPCGNWWYLATRVEDLTPEEIAKRAAEAAGGGA